MVRSIVRLPSTRTFSIVWIGMSTDVASSGTVIVSGSACSRPVAPCPASRCRARDCSVRSNAGCVGRHRRVVGDGDRDVDRSPSGTAEVDGGSERVDGRAVADLDRDLIEVDPEPRHLHPEWRIPPVLHRQTVVAKIAGEHEHGAHVGHVVLEADLVHRVVGCIDVGSRSPRTPRGSWSDHRWRAERLRCPPEPSAVSIAAMISGRTVARLFCFAIAAASDGLLSHRSNT